MIEGEGRDYTLPIQYLLEEVKASEDIIIKHRQKHVAQWKDHWKEKTQVFLDQENELWD